MGGIKKAGGILLRGMGILGIFILLLSSLSWLKPDGEVQSARVIFVGTGEDADCAVLLSRDQCVVIDTGEEQDAERILTVLREQAVDKIDCLILTHPDQDHIGGAPRLLEEMEVELVLAPYYVQEKERYQLLLDQIHGMGIRFLTPSRNREFHYGDLRIRVFPPDDRMYEKDNDYSLVVLAEHRDVGMLFMGDAEKKRLQETDSYRLGHVDLYKVPHHGRDSAKGAGLIERLRPSIAVVTAQEAGPGISRALGLVGAETYYTVPRKDIVLESDGNILKKVPDSEAEPGMDGGL